jgi:aspartate aminotransferase-like enzyme
VQNIEREKPSVVFVPHVETSTGIQLPVHYLKRLSASTHENGGLLVVDCIASGSILLDMDEMGIDILISAPQKGWSSVPCCGIVMLNQLALDAMSGSTSTSFSCDLSRWLGIMRAYENGGFAYHSTMPTDGLLHLRTAMREANHYGFSRLLEKQVQLGGRIRKCLTESGFSSVAAPGYEASTVVVSYTKEKEIQSGTRFARFGMQVAAGVPIMCDEGDEFSTFRVGLFGLDKLMHIDRTVELFEDCLSKVNGEE